MHLDHVAYAVTNAELADTVQRLGAELGVAFIDGGKHPRAGTRNFIFPMASGQYIEIVAPLEHPVAETVPFGQAVRNRAEAGGGWMGWAVRVDDVAPLEARIGRQAGLGHRLRPGGADLTWKQIGVIDLIAEPILPFFIKWDDMSAHPSVGGSESVSITEFALSGDRDSLTAWLGDTPETMLDDIALTWVEDDEIGLSAVTFQTPNGSVTIN
jgi:catechol 2,3-dioxygenase-like lactoylglutathione lyase family enzyme